MLAPRARAGAHGVENACEATAFEGGTGRLTQSANTLFVVGDHFPLRGRQTPFCLGLIAGLGRMGCAQMFREFPPFMRVHDVRRATTLSNSSLYRAIKAGTFPRPIRFDGHRRAVWIGAEVRDWCERQVRLARGSAEGEGSGNLPEASTVRKYSGRPRGRPRKSTANPDAQAHASDIAALGAVGGLSR